MWIILQCLGFINRTFRIWIGLIQIDEFSLSIALFRGVMAATECYIVHEIYNGENAQEQFEYELEQALEAQYRYIVIEPTRIGDETARWVAVGNCLHKSAVLAGATCLLTPLALPADYSRYVALPAGALSLACAALYSISWQFDPCCKYQVEYDSQKLSRLPLHTLTSSSPVVLVRRDDVHRKTAQHDSVGGPGVLCQEDLWTVRCMSAMAHAHTRIQILIYAYTHKHTAGRWEALLNTRHWQIHTHTPNKTYGWTDGESDGKTKGGGALSVTLFQRFAFNQLKIERMGGWMDGWMDERKGWGGACSSEWIFPISLYFKSDITSALEPPFPLLPCACPAPSSSRRLSPNVTCHPWSFRTRAVTCRTERVVDRRTDHVLRMTFESSFLPLCSFTVPCLWCITFSLNSRRFNFTGISDHLYLTLKGSDSFLAHIWVLAFKQSSQADLLYKPWFVMDQFESGSSYEVMKSKYERWAENGNSSEMDSSLHP